MEKATNLTSGSHRREGNRYRITEAEVEQYGQNGYLICNSVLTEEEMELLDHWFEHFISGKESDRMRRDFCDMSQPYGTSFDQFQLVNAMLPSTYRPELADNIFHKVAASIANQLYSEGTAAMDYEQFLAKRPLQEGAEFAMHQDLGYWPKIGSTWTATFSLALTDSDLANGCLQLIPGSNREPELRKHVPKSYAKQEGDSFSRDESHTLVIETSPDDRPVYLPVRRGCVTVHDERIIHGSGGNTSNDWRKTYVVAFRDSETIKAERAIGFTHSHNDSIDWEAIIPK